MSESLDDFLAAIKDERKCWLCNIPEREEVERVRATNSKASYPLIRDWLISRGYTDTTQAKVAKHFQNGHARKPA